MRRLSGLSWLLLSVSWQALGAGPLAKIDTDSGRINVGIFQGHGSASDCITDAHSALAIDSEMAISIITANDILGGVLERMDAIVFPGGGGASQFSNLGSFAVEKVKKFVMEDGKGVVGICAGAYMLSNTPAYTCFKMSAYQAIDLEHDERGNGTISFRVNKMGEKVFPEFNENGSYFIHYYEGPLLVNNPIAHVTTDVLAYMTSDVALKDDAPHGMTFGKPLFLNGKAGNGRIFLSVAHPENTPGLRWMLPRMVRWVANRPLVSYSPEVVRPNLYTKEILFDKKLRGEEEQLFKNLMYGSSAEQVSSIERLVAIKSWSARDRIPGLLRDHDPLVRMAAARALADLQRVEIIPEIDMITNLEKDPSVKIELTKQLNRLKNMLGADLKRAIDYPEPTGEGSLPSNFR